MHSESVSPELIVRRDGPPLREVVGVSELRPRPPPPQPGREFELFDLVEAYNNDGWWPGVVSDIRPKRRRNQAKRFAVSLPLFREVLELSASFVRPRREFVYGSWIDAQEVLPALFYRIQTSFWFSTPGVSVSWWGEGVQQFCTCFTGNNLSPA